MIWLKLLVLVLIASLCDSGQSTESYLVYALERDGSLTFYLMDTSLKNPQEIFKLNNTNIDRMYLNEDKQDLVVYWSYKNSSVIGRYEDSTGKKNVKRFHRENTIFLGVGDDDKIYLYSPISKNITVYEYGACNKHAELNGLKRYETDMHCVDVDPGDRELVFFAKCSNAGHTGIFYDVRENVAITYENSDLPKCFDTWSIMPNGRGIYAVSGREVYMSISDGSPNASNSMKNKPYPYNFKAYAKFVKHYTIKEDIVGFAAGNDMFFYGTEDKDQGSKIFRVSGYGKEYKSYEVKVDGTIKLLAFYKKTKRNYLIYATQRNSVLQFVKNDLDFRRPKTVHKVNTRGKEIDKMYLNSSNDGEVLFWSYKNSDILGRVDVATGKKEEKHLNQKFGTFLGVGYKDDIYFYNSDNKTFIVYDYKDQVEKGQLEIADLHCADVDRNYKDEVFINNCTETGMNDGKFIDVKSMKYLEDYSIKTQYCFDICKMNPYGIRIYALQNQAIYETDPFDFAEFKVFMSSSANIQELAVGSNEIFYTSTETGGTRIYKLSGLAERSGSADFYIKGNVKALAIHQDL